MIRFSCVYLVFYVQKSAGVSQSRVTFVCLSKTARAFLSFLVCSVGSRAAGYVDVCL